MMTREKQPTNRMYILWLTVALAGLAAVSYVLIGRNLLPVGDLQPTEQPAVIIYVAAVSYLLGGLLILLRRRWLWIVGAVLNALVILVFFSAYLDRPAVLFSPGGLLSKAAQLLLEGGLIYLILRDTPWSIAQGERTNAPRTCYGFGTDSTIKQRMDRMRNDGRGRCREGSRT